MDSTAKRIKELIDSLGLTNSEFAKQANLNPATISHILGGRNKASLQVIGNIKESFTNVNTDYLITGEGELLKDFTNVNTSSQDLNSGSAFPMEGVRLASIGAMPLTPEKEPEQPPSEPVNSEAPKSTSPTLPESQKEAEQGNVEKAKDKPVERIVIFYTDGTFDSYLP